VPHQFIAPWERFDKQIFTIEKADDRRRVASARMSYRPRHEYRYGHRQGELCGAHKAACERVVLDALGPKATIARTVLHRRSARPDQPVRVLATPVGHWRPDPHAEQPPERAAVADVEESAEGPSVTLRRSKAVTVTSWGGWTAPAIRG